MNKLGILFTLVLLTGCAGTVDTVKSWVPSFWDDQQSASIIDIRQSALRIQCGSDSVADQVAQLQSDLQWFRLYSESKGWQQRDVLVLIEPIEQTAEDFASRIDAGSFSKGYCGIKKRLLVLQTERAASTILGRF